MDHLRRIVEAKAQEQREPSVFWAGDLSYITNHIVVTIYTHTHTQSRVSLYDQQDKKTRQSYKYVRNKYISEMKVLIIASEREKEHQVMRKGSRKRGTYSILSWIFGVAFVRLFVRSFVRSLGRSVGQTVQL